MTQTVDAARLPRIDAALIIETVGLEVFRDQFGMHQCVVRGVGPRRKKLGPSPDQAFTAHEDTAVTRVEIARDEARYLLKQVCDACRFKNCRMKKWAITTPLSSHG